MAENGATIGTAFVHVVPSAEGIQGSLQNVLDPESKAAGVLAGNNIASQLKSIIIKAGIGKVLKDVVQGALEAGGALQQSFGGLETLYGDAAKDAQRFAYEAAAAGISANTYAEQAVSFGAALKQAFGGDTYAAMEAANAAILDMADNSAKFGTDITAVQTAYQGFAKQNYTMLDNLKLGYGGTKTEMERLLKDAEALSGVHYDLSNLGDVYAAIHVIQEELGVTNVAADEAATTLTGSAQSVKAAWQNVLANLSLGQSLTKPLQQLLSSTRNFFIGNFLPMIGNVLTGIPTAIGSMLMTSGIDMMHSLGEGFIQGVPAFLETALPAVLTAVTSLRQNFGTVVDAGIEFVMNLARGIVNGLPQLIAYVPQIITNVAGIINDNMPKILKAGMDIIIMLGKGIIQNLPVIIANMGNIVEAAVSVISAINWLALGQKIVQLIGNGIKALANNVPNALRSIGQQAMNGFRGINWSSLGSAIINGIVNGMRWAGGALKNMLLGLASDALNAAKRFLRIGSPSKVFADQVGKWIPAGIAVGIEDNSDAITMAVDTMSAETVGAFTAEPAQSVTNNRNVGDITVNVIGAAGQDVDELAQAVADRINAMINGQAAVYA